MGWTGEDLSSRDLACHVKLFGLYSGLQGTIGGFQAKKFGQFYVVE